MCEDEQRAQLKVAIESWGMYLVDCGYLIGRDTDIDSLLPQ